MVRACCAEDMSVIVDKSLCRRHAQVAVGYVTLYHTRSSRRFATAQHSNMPACTLLMAIPLLLEVAVMVVVELLNDS
jgi:hypothetical protein